MSRIVDNMLKEEDNLIQLRKTILASVRKRTTNTRFLDLAASTLKEKYSHGSTELT